MSQSRSHLSIAAYATQFFANDGKLDDIELGQLLDLARADGVCDEDELRVLRNLMSKIRPDEFTPKMKSMIAEFEAEFAINLAAVSV